MFEVAENGFFHTVQVMATSDQDQTSFHAQCTQITWIITTVSSFIRILRIFELTKKMGDTIEAILAILVNAVKIMVLITVIWVGFLAAGWSVLKTELQRIKEKLSSSLPGFL